MSEIPAPLNHTIAAIYAAIVGRRRAGTGDGAGVAMSDCVNPCDRATWYSLHWASPPEEIDGEKASRFETGELWEARLLDDLEASGVHVERTDPHTGKQIVVTLAGGILRGKLDGKAIGLPDAPQTMHVVECKSHNEKSFKALVKDGVAKSKPDHFAQCQSYMHGTGVSRCLYLAVNKNTDERYAERIAYDPVFAAGVEARILRIAHLPAPPPRLHDDPTSKAAFACGWCRHKAVCHEGAFARVNCRTCLSSTVGAPAWSCEREVPSFPLTYDTAQKGCDRHRYIPALVPGEQVDVIDGDLVVYQLANGEQWIDGERT